MDRKSDPAVPIVQAPTEPAEKAEPKAVQHRYALRRLLLALWLLGLVPLFAALHTHVPGNPFHRCMIGTALLALPTVAAFWLLGRDANRTVRVWRIVFVVWMLLLAPFLINIADGLAEEGWPTGRFNRSIARVLSMFLTVSIPSYVAGVFAALKLPRLTGLLAIVAGIVALSSSATLFDATAPIPGLRFHLVSILDVVALGAKSVTYLAIPMGVALVVGGAMTLRSARARTPTTP
jgi:hypothetical protein